MVIGDASETARDFWERFNPQARPRDRENADIAVSGSGCRTLQNRCEQKKDNSGERYVPNERTEQGHAKCVERKVHQSGLKMETNAPFARRGFTAKHMDKNDCSHKHRKRFEEVSKYPFQTLCDPRERRDFSVASAGRPTITALKTSCVGGRNNLDQTEHAARGKHG
jgi:hypothetical protein